MAYNKRDLEKQSLEAITKYNLLFIEDVCTFLPCSRSTFYEKDLDKSDAIKEAINDNKVKTKNKLRKKWYENGNPTTQIALYKLIGNGEELRRLTGQTIIGDKDNPLKHEFTGFNFLPDGSD